MTTKKQDETYRLFRNACKLKLMEIQSRHDLSKTTLHELYQKGEISHREMVEFGRLLTTVRPNKRAFDPGVR